MTERAAGNIISGGRLYLHVPEFRELDYRQKLMSDPETMSYNREYDLGLILNELRKEAHYDHVEVCVKKDDTEAIRLYRKVQREYPHF